MKPWVWKWSAALGGANPALASRQRGILLAAALVLLLGSCTPNVNFGPLAVSVEDMGGNLARMEGSVDITDTCITIHDPSGTTFLPIWPAGRTRWDPVLRRVVFLRRDGREVALRQGDYVELGGSGRESSWGDLLGSVRWARRPNVACTTEWAWFVGDADHEAPAFEQ